MRINSPWSLRRGSYVYRHFGSWENVRKNSVYDPIEGVWRVKVPAELRKQMEADPKCHPPVKKSFFAKLFGK